MRTQTRNLVTQVIFLIILLIALVLPRAFSLTRFVAVDEVNWVHRSATFYDAIMKNHWGETYINNSPGVITTWVGALAYKIAAPDYRITDDKMKTSYMAFENNLTRNEKVQPLYILALSRAIMVTLLVAVLLLSFLYAQRLFGMLPSLAGFLIIALDPFFIALTRMNHLDAPQAVFMFLSLLAFMNYLFRGKRFLDLVISGAAGGLALLSKLPGIFIVPIIGLLAFWDYFATKIFPESSNKHLVSKPFWKMFQSLIIWALVFILAFAAVWPAIWVQPLETTSNLFEGSKSVGKVIGERNRESQGVLASLFNRSLSVYLRYPESFLWRTTPIVLLGIILLIYAFLSREEIVKNKITQRGVLGLLLFVVVYTAGMTLMTKSSEKYYAPVYLAMDFLAGLGWYSFAIVLSKSFRKLPREYISAAILIAAIFIQSIWVYQSFPYYYTHKNPLLASMNLTQSKSIWIGTFVGVGEGLDQAGLYLMEKPNSSKLKVMSWYGIGPFSYYFNGTVVPLYLDNSRWTPEFIRGLKEMDYLVVYKNQISRNQTPPLLEILSKLEPEHTVIIQGEEYAWIYKVKDIPLPDRIE